MNATNVNHQIRLAARPTGLPDASCWDLTTEPVPVPGPGEFVVQTSHVSVDPAMRAWMNETRSYIAPVGIGDVMRALALGTVVASEHPDFAVGEHVTGVFGVQEYALSDGGGMTKVDPGLAPLETYLGVLGISGITAYFGLLDVGELKQGETVVVSGAAGSVGSVAGQIAKLNGCRVIGIAGGPDKCSWLTGELGFDAAIDYKSQDVGAALREHAPNRVDVFFDNVGGEILDAVLGRLAGGARIVICGGVSQYNAQAARGPANYLALIAARGKMTGFVVFDYAARYGEAIAALAGWLREGKIVSRDYPVSGGVQAFPDALLKLFAGENTGKLLLTVP
jgi:NADPH-dependent curcumin reductase CurA